jgi:ABC-type transport system involved in multi-copper enzyme maturation permease subunit
MKARMRSPRAFLLIGLYLIGLAVLIFLVYIQSGGGSSYSYGGSSQFTYGPTRSFEIGQNLFITIFLYLSLVIALISPALTGSAISREIEARTYELLLVTSLKRRALIYSKYFSALFYVILLVLLSLPLACLIFTFGGVDSGELLSGYAVVLVSAAAYCAIGAFFSSLIKQTGAAVLASYILVALLIFGSQLVSSSIVGAINSDTSRFPPGAPRPDPRIDPAFDLPRRLLVLNPMASIGSILTSSAPLRFNNNDDLKFFPSSQLFGGSPNSYFRNTSGQQNAAANAVARMPVFPNGWSLWGGYVLVYSGITALFLVLSSTFVKSGRLERGFRLFSRKEKPERKKKQKKKKL